MSDPIAQYFDQYETFTYYPQRDWRQRGAFNALAKHLGWSQEDRKLAYEDFKETWTQIVEGEFAQSTLQHYQDLCDELGIEDIPDTVTQCKNKLWRVYVNIVDLMQYRRDKSSGGSPPPLTVFETAKELAEYTDREKKWCPVQTASAEMLRCYSTSGIKRIEILHTVGSVEIIDIFVVIEIQVSDT